METSKENKQILSNEMARTEKAKKITWVGFVVNLILSVAKVIAGFIGNSGAMIADGVHSVSDSVTDVIVILFIGVSARGENHKYRYGHGKFETFATMLISFALFIVAVGLLWESVSQIIDAINGKIPPRPGMVALIMAVISIGVKEWMFQYTRIVGEQINSMALVANAWHHRSDAFSSIAVLVGVGCAMFLGDSWRILDPIAAAVVSIFIGLVAYRLAMPSICELLEISLPESVNSEIRAEIAKVDGVIAFHHLRTRKNGNIYIIDFHIKVMPQLTIVEAHEIANCTEKSLKQKYGENAIINIHIEPYNGESVGKDKICTD